MSSTLLFFPFFFWSPFHGLFSLLFTIVLVVVLISLFRDRHHYPAIATGPVPPAGPTPPAGPGPVRSQALDILESRYARGEIQRDEYLEKKQDLGG